MYWVGVSVILFVNCYLVKSTEANYTFTHRMASYCKEHVSLHGYRYETFYRVDSEDRRKLEKEQGIVFEMHIAILAASNGHILLCSKPNPSRTDDVYEIVVGGGANSFTELRRKLKKDAKVSVKTMGILSPIQFIPFYMKISEDGEFEFGEEGQPEPLFRFMDVNPIEINYFSFASWTDVAAKFLYDCPVFSMNGTDWEEACPSATPIFTDTSNSTLVEVTLPKSEKLRQTLMFKHPPYVPPGTTVPIKIAVMVTSVQFNSFDAKLTIGISLVMRWQDDTMVWDPNDFNITQLSFRQAEIWKPTFFVVNSEEMSVLDGKNQEKITVLNNGEAVFHFQTKTTTWCPSDQDPAWNRWPHDEHFCQVIIGPWNTHEQFIISNQEDDPLFKNRFSEYNDIIESEWESIKDTDVINNQFVISMNLKRRATTYKIVLYTPLLVFMIFVLMSFWSETLSMSRVWLYVGFIIVLCMGLCYVDYLMPCQNAPIILLLYTLVLFGVLVALLLQLVLVMPIAQPYAKKTQIQSIMSRKSLRTIFCLPPISETNHYESITEVYASQSDEDNILESNARSNVGVEEMESEVVRNEMQEVAEVVDKSMFIIYSIIFAVMLAI